MVKEKILIIDDSLQIRDFLARQVLPREGYTCVTAGDGKAGLEMLGREKPDIVLTDMQMPRMSGLEMLQLLAQYKVDIPVVMMTAHGSETVAIEAFRLGVKDYIVKPFTVDEVLAVVGRALTETRLRREKEVLARNLAAANQQLERRVQEMAVLARVGQAVSALLEPPILMKRIVEAAVFITNAQRGALLLSQPAGLRMSATAGFPDTAGSRIVPAGSLVAATLAAAQPVALAAPQLAVEPYGRSAPPPQAFLATPISAKSARLGVLSVDRTQANRPFNSGDGRLLAALADYAAISLQNVRLFDQAKGAQDKLEAVISHIADGVIVLDAGGNVVLANPAAESLLGVALPLAKPVPASGATAPLVQLMSRPGTLARPAAQEIAGSRGKVLNVTASPVPDLGAVAVLHDITMMRELERIHLEREQGEVERLRGLYERYAPPALVDQLSRHADDALSHPEEREVTVLSAGLRGFDELFAQLAPDTLVETMLNRYFDAMSAIVTRHGGTLDKYTGNGLRAVFGWPIAKADDAAQAVASAVEMQVMFGRLCLQWQQTLNVTVTLGIGIGLGKVVAGSIGSPKHQDYTVLGQGVSIALALEQQAHGGEILMSHALVGRLPSSLEGVEFEEFPPVPVRGMPGEHEIVLVRFEPSPGATQLLPATT